MHRPDESLDWTEKNIDMQTLRFFGAKPKMKKIEMFVCKEIKSALFFSTTKKNMTNT